MTSLGAQSFSDVSRLRYASPELRGRSPQTWALDYPHQMVATNRFPASTVKSLHPTVSRQLALMSGSWRRRWPTRPPYQEIWLEIPRSGTHALSHPQHLDALQMPPTTPGKKTMLGKDQNCLLSELSL